MDLNLEIDDDRCGRLQVELPADAADEDVAYSKVWWHASKPGCSSCGTPGPARWYSVAGLRSLASRC